MADTATAPAPVTAPLPVKPVNRQKPFTRIRNDARIVQDSEVPDGDGVVCGCHTPDELDSNLENDFKQFLDKKLPVPLLKILDTIKDIANKAADAANVAKIIAALAAAAAAAGALGGAIGAFVAAVTAVGKAIEAINSVVKQIVDIITKALHTFFDRLAQELIKQSTRVIPQWVPVKKGASSQTITSDQIKDVEGIVTRSYGDPIEPPFFQWHRWLNWSIQVTPEKRYNNVLVPGFTFNTDERTSGEQSLIKDATFEIQWDSGALWEPPIRFGEGDPFESGFEEAEMPAIDGPMLSAVSSPNQTGTSVAPSNWIWPMAGMYVWASGRWVYDCSRTNKLKPDKTQTDDKLKMCAMMNPPRAIATACFEAFQFSENLPGESDDTIHTRVPAIRFMFFTSKRGGYMSYDSISDEDYEFILDLPSLDQEIAPFPIGHTFVHDRDGDPPPDFPHNTVVLRPRLLKNIETLSFGAGEVKTINPIIKVLPPPKPGAAPQQVKVTIKASAIAALNSNQAGCILSLGWFDPNRTQAAQVKDCTVKFDSLRAILQKESRRDTPGNLVRNRFKREIDDAKKAIENEVLNIKVPFPFIPRPISINDMINNTFPNSPLPAHDLVRDLGLEFKKIATKVVDETFNKLLAEIAGAVNSTQTEEWLLRVGVNGRWQTRFLGNVDDKELPIADAYEFNISLGPDDQLFFSSGGVEFNPVGDMMRAKRTDRLVRKMNDKGDDLDPFTWNEIVTAIGKEREELLFNYVLKILGGNSASGLALGIENTVLGINDPGDTQSAANPIAAKQAQSGPVAPVANFAESTGEKTTDEQILVVDAGRKDYQLKGTLTVQPQKFR